LLGTPRPAGAQARGPIAVILNPSNPENGLATEDLRCLYLGVRTAFPKSGAGAPHRAPGPARAFLRGGARHGGRFLQRLGHHADIAANGLEAVEAVRRLPYDLVLMDCQMPDMDGFEATREIRALDRDGRRLTIVAMTANAMQGDRERCLAAGMDDYLSKPVSVEKLASVLQRWLPEERADRPADEGPAGRAPINLARLESITGSDRMALRKYLKLFVTSTEPVLGKTAAAVAARNGAEVRRLAHSLKGGCGSVGAEEMAELAGELEAAGGSEAWPQVQLLSQSLEQAFGRVGSFVRFI
jgi:CheY-like chemotaxis protein/HPt (histidine-containing phosphotransfer) domain-containing protein